ncbi:MAG: stage II sporulation protein M [bacterium]|nr:stage II sporulation protein M [bacterium]
MAGFTLKSFEFRREREAAWRELEELVKRVAQRGLRGLDAAELYRLPALYRAALSSLSVARAISLDKNVVTYLESLAARAYLAVYGAKRDYLETVARFITRGFPAQVRALRFHVLLAMAVMFLGGLCGFALTVHDANLFYSLVPEGLAAGRGPSSSRRELYEVLKSSDGGLSLLAGFLFSHNAKIGMMCFGLGFAAGVPVALLLYVNGLILGAFAAIHWQHGLSLEFWAWVLPHGVTELLAVCLCGGVGFALGQALVFPGRFSRLDNLAQRGRETAVVVFGAVLMFFLAALIEGFFRQLVLAEVPRLLMVAASGAFWLWYFAIHGRRSV